LKLLEDEFGYTLLKRSRQDVSLTLLGEVFLPEARDILQRTDEAVRRLKASASGVVGRLSIGFVDNVLWTLLTPIIGGGYVLGSAASNDGLNWQLATENAAVVVSVDYRLAPETRFPGPVDDCYTGLRWLFQNAGTLEVDERRITIMGDSAGGGLAAATTLLARSKGVPAFGRYVDLSDARSSVGLRPGSSAQPHDRGLCLDGTGQSLRMVGNEGDLCRR